VLGAVGDAVSGLEDVAGGAEEAGSEVANEIEEAASDL